MSEPESPPLEKLVSHNPTTSIWSTKRAVPLSYLMLSVTPVATTSPKVWSVVQPLFCTRSPTDVSSVAPVSAPMSRDGAVRDDHLVRRTGIRIGQRDRRVDVVGGLVSALAEFQRHVAVQLGDDVRRNTQAQRAGPFVQQARLDDLISVDGRQRARIGLIFLGEHVVVAEDVGIGPVGHQRSQRAGVAEGPIAIDDVLDAAARDAQLERSALKALMVDRIVGRCRRRQGETDDRR